MSSTGAKCSRACARTDAELHRIDADDLVEAPEADVKRRMRDELDDLGLGEVAPQLLPERIVDLVVVDGQLLGEPDRRALARRQEVGRLVVDRRDLRLGRACMPGPGIADRLSVATVVEGSDLEADQLAQHWVDRAFPGERAAEGIQRLHDDRILPIGPRARRGARLALGLLAEMADLVVEFVDAERLDPWHRVLLQEACMIGRFSVVGKRFSVHRRTGCGTGRKS